MTEIRFYSSEGKIIGFEISGHSGYAEEGSDIVCASISSCAYMVCNTITEVMGIAAETVEVYDGYMNFRIAESDCEKAKDLLSGFQMHVKLLADDYKKYVVCKNENII
ncbi:MAG: ribosomal-processing cysteine protease Prp [Clostridia bacterium]|nr:ribosomal-processing cysteine protease Prp [Clostridia bacterium]